MENKKLLIGILFGGKSAEHEISLISAANVVAAIDKDRYQPLLIGIDKKGRWLLCDDNYFAQKEAPKLDDFPDTKAVALLPDDYATIICVTNPNKHYRLDAAFPVLHGGCGEDGTVQGLLKLANLPFVGAGVLGSAVGMDKDVMKRLLRDAGIPIGKFLVVSDSNKNEINFSKTVAELGLPMFVKPANTGSSVGISKVKNEADFHKAVADAFQFDRKIIIEEFIDGREIECAVLGNDKPEASLPGEIIPHHEFYSYEAKYLDENGATLEIPAKLTKTESDLIRVLAVKAFKVLACEGMARVDFFLKSDGSPVMNEINTIPGFTSISMYPKMWAATGVDYSTLIDKLIQLAIERFQREQLLKTSYCN
jgi:D-alanine-D-alanine ligase